jgi:DNA-binding transcriptional LysR family regulator
MEHDETTDLNLLRTLDVLLEEANVSHAARRLHVTQPAVSRALGKLRAAFGDELLVRAGRGMRPTARALAIQPRLRAALAGVDQLLAPDTPFDPRTSRRRFHVAAIDAAQVVVLAPFLRRLPREAPGVDVVVRESSPETDRDLEAGMIDLYVGPKRPLGAAAVWTPIAEERFTCLVWRGARPRRLTRKGFAAMEHVLVAPWGRPGGVIDEQLAAHGLRRRIALQVPTFLVLPHVLEGTSRVATVPSRIGGVLASTSPLRVVPLPLSPPSFPIFVAWHEVHRDDAAHRWLRRRLAEVVAEVHGATRPRRQSA